METERALTAIVFSLIPPTGRIFPVNDTSPVMATFCLTGQFIANDSKAVTIVHPALGPSFGVAPFKKNNTISTKKPCFYLIQRVAKPDKTFALAVFTMAPISGW